MAINLAQARHSFGTIPEDHRKDLDNIQQDRTVTYKQQERTWSQDTRETQTELIPRSMGDRVFNQTLRGDTTFQDLQSSEGSPEREDMTSDAADVCSINPIEGESKPQQDQHKQVTGDQPDCQGTMHLSSSEDEEPPPPPPKDTPVPPAEIFTNAESYFNPMGLSRANSLYSISRVSFSNQLSQLTTLSLPQASSLSSSISTLGTAPAAAKALSGAAGQIQKWIQKASEVLGGLDADDDAEWAAAGGREGLEEVENAAGRFEGLIVVYVAAIEELQLREDIATVPSSELEAVVEQMEKTMKNWEEARRMLKGVKEQVELAMEWEELWVVVLGDIGLEMEALSRLVFEMEEKRHKSLMHDTGENGNGIDIGELETIVEETPMGGKGSTNHRFSLPAAFSATSPIQESRPTSAHDDSSLMALFARMQPLRASLDFLPMRLSTFHARAEAIFPSACEELESRRRGLEKKWVKLEGDAEALRRELGEDRWVLVFRNAGRQAQKMCDSVERSVDKLQEAIDSGSQHSNPPALAKKVDNYEAKKMHYGPAIQRVLGIIEKGLNDRLTVNGEILRLHSDMQSRWSVLEAVMKDMDAGLEDLNLKKSQQLRDSLSSIISIDRSAAGSGLDTPRSSPASSVVMTPTTGNKANPTTPGANGNSRRGSFMSSTTSRPNTGKRYFSMPPGPVGSSNIPRKTPTSRSSASSSYGNRAASPSPGLKNGINTPTPTGRNSRPTAAASDGRPRWISSGNMNGTVVGHNFNPSSLTTPSPHRRTSTPIITPHSNSSKSSIPLPSPLGRESSASPAPNSPALPRARKPSGTHSSLAFTDGKPLSTPAHTPRESLDATRPKFTNKVATSYFSSKGRRQSVMLDPGESVETPKEEEDSSPSTTSKASRPATAMASGRRSSMLPQLKARAASGRDSAMGAMIGNGMKANGEE
ncbi:MAG: hypothetical protein M1830_003878, partial [Pleopsidium flavum]